MRVTVIGAGRWAAVYRRLLHGHELSDGYDTDAAIIVNKAQHHEDAARKFIQAGIPTLVEKPFAMSVQGVRALDKLSMDNRTYVAAAHVLKFAGYLDRFAAGLTAPHYASITWSDPAVGRHYDPTLSVAHDVMPHIISIVDTLFPGRTITLEGWTTGTPNVDVRLMAGSVCIDVRMARDSDARRRLIEVAAGGSLHRLDFAVNPTDENPLAKLIAAFLEGAGGGHKDARLDLRLAFLAAGLTERCLEKIGA